MNMTNEKLDAYVAGDPHWRTKGDPVRPAAPALDSSCAKAYRRRFSKATCAQPQTSHNRGETISHR